MLIFAFGQSDVYKTLNLTLVKYLLTCTSDRALLGCLILYLGILPPNSVSIHIGKRKAIIIY